MPPKFIGTVPPFWDPEILIDVNGEVIEVFILNQVIEGPNYIQLSHN